MQYSNLRLPVLALGGNLQWREALAKPLAIANSPVAQFMKVSENYIPKPNEIGTAKYHTCTGSGGTAICFIERRSMEPFLTLNGGAPFQHRSQVLGILRLRSGYARPQRGPLQRVGRLWQHGRFAFARLRSRAASRSTSPAPPAALHAASSMNARFRGDDFDGRECFARGS